MKVKPATKDLLVPLEGQPRAYVPAEGIKVEPTTYYLRAIKRGDLVTETPSAPKPSRTAPKAAEKE